MTKSVAASPVPAKTPETKGTWIPPTIDVIPISESELFENFGVDFGSFS